LRNDEEKLFGVRRLDAAFGASALRVLRNAEFWEAKSKRRQATALQKRRQAAALQKRRQAAAVHRKIIRELNWNTIRLIYVSASFVLLGKSCELKSGRMFSPRPLSTSEDKQ
jgi:hypothetical protein